MRVLQYLRVSFGTAGRARVRLLLTLALSAVLVCGVATLADARVGGGGSMGSRGSRSFSAPVRPSTPSPGNAFGQRSPSYAQPDSPRTQEPFSRSTPFPQSSPSGGGGFWRSVG